MGRKIPGADWDIPGDVNHKKNMEIYRVVDNGD
jgi:hypothetical protein